MEILNNPKPQFDGKANVNYVSNISKEEAFGSKHYTYNPVPVVASSGFEFYKLNGYGSKGTVVLISVIFININGMKLLAHLWQE